MKNVFLLFALCLLFFNSANAQTEVEPNDVWNQSNLASIGVTGSGTTELNQGEDWWRVVTPSDGALSITWAGTNGQYTYCVIYDTLGTIQLYSNYTQGAFTGVVDGLAKGTYYFKFYSYYGYDASAYTFTPTFTTAPVANDVEPNNTYVTGNTLPLNGTLTGHSNYYFNNMRDTLDWRKITTTVSGKLSWTITSANGSYVYADLFNGDGTTLITGNYTNGTFTQSADGLAAGTYYIRSKTFYSNEFVPYTISNAFTAPTNISEPEPNQTIPTATVLPLNGSAVGQIGYSYNGIRDTMDWWSVNVNQDGRLDFTITSDDGQNVYALLYDGDGTTYLSGDYTQGTATYSKDGLAPGVYYIKVRTFYSNEFSSYSLSNSLVVPAVAPEAPASNNIAANATPFGINSTLTGHIGYRYNGIVDTTDWFKIITPLDGKLEWTITVANGQNVYALLYDGTATTLLAGNYSTGTSTFSKDGLLAGTYFLKFYTFYATEFSPYTISNLFTPAPLLTDVESNDTKATATTFAVNSTVTGHTGFANGNIRDNIDYYAVTLPEDGRFSFTITSQNGYYIYANLYDSDGVTLLAGNNTNSTITLLRNDLAAGTYYIEVHTFYPTEFTSYTLSSVFEPMNFAAEGLTNNSIPAFGTLLPSNTTKTGHSNFYYNNARDTADYWKIGYDGPGTMSLHLDLEQDHFDTDYPYINYELFSDTLMPSIYYGTVHNPTNTISFSGLAVGIYYLRVSSNFNTFGAYSLNAEYIENCVNIVGISSSAQLAGCNGTITYNISGGLAPYSVQLYKDGIPSGSLQTTNGSITFNSLGLGSYYARSYSFGGSGICNNISSSTIFSGQPTPSITPGSATTFCQGGSVTLSSTAAASYLWSTGETTQSIVVTTSGSYTVKTYNAAGCESIVSNSTTVTVNPLPTVPVISANGLTTFCQGGSVTLTSTPATGYLWSTGATTQAISTSTAGNFSVTVTNANGCSASSSVTSVTVNPLPTTPTINASGPITFCQGGSVLLTSSSATNNSWSTGANTQSITANASGTFSVTVSNVNGCTATSLPKTVTVNPLPTVSFAPLSSVCNTSGSFTLTGGSPSGGTYSGTGVSGGQFNPATAGVGTFTITYSYTNGNNCTNIATQSITVTNCSGCTASITPSGSTTFCDGGSVGLSSSAGVSYAWSTGATTQSITASSSGTFTVTVTDANSCSATASIVVTETTPVVASSSATAILCNGGTSTVTVSATGGTMPYTGTGNFSRTAGTYSFTVTDANSCSASTSITVTQPTILVASSSGTPILCNNGTSIVTISASGGTAPYSGTGNFTRTAGTYSFTVTDSKGCSSSTSITITQPTALSASANAATAITCFGGSTTVTVSATGGTSPYTGTGTFSQSVGTIVYAVSDFNGCTTTASRTLIQPTKVEGTTSTIPASGCSIADGSATVNPTGGAGGYTYLWSNGASTQTASGLSAAVYTVTITDTNGCTGSTSATVSGAGGSVGTPGSISGPSGSCRNASGIVYSVSPVAGATSYNWTLPAGATGISSTNSISVSFSNSYGGGYICVSANNSCGAGLSSCLNVPVLTVYPSLPTVISGPAIACGAGTYVYSTSSANATDYIWTVTGTGVSIQSGQGTNSIIVSVPVNFSQGSVQVRGSNCVGSSAVRGMNITGIPVHSNAVSGPSFVCANGTATYSMNVVPGVSTYTWSASSGATLANQTLTSTQSIATFNFDPTWTGGTISVDVSNSCGSFARTFAVRTTPVQPGGITGPGTALCNQSNVGYSIVAVAGATSYTWTVPTGITLFSTAANGLSIVVNVTPAFTGTGNICVTANNSCGQGVARCFAVTARPAVPVISGATAVCKSQSNVPYTISPVTGASSYSWSISGGASIVPSGNTANVNYNSSISTSAALRANANNACGASQPGALGVTVSLLCRTASESEEVLGDTEFALYPNPTKDKTTLSLYSKEEIKYQIKVTDLLGRVMYSESMIAKADYNSTEINMSDFAKGIYLINISDESGNVATKRIVVE